jgi:hypothetical protein
MPKTKEQPTQNVAVAARKATKEGTLGQSIAVQPRGGLRAGDIVLLQYTHARCSYLLVSRLHRSRSGETRVKACVPVLHDLVRPVDSQVWLRALKKGVALHAKQSEMPTEPVPTTAA